MKKLLSFLFVFLFFLTGSVSCSSKNNLNIEFLSGSYSCKALIEYDTFKISANIERPSPGLCMLDITEPKELAGVKIKAESENLTITYMDIKINPDLESPIKTSFASLLVKALDSAAKLNEIEAYKKDVNTVVKGAVPDGDYEIIINENSELSSLSIPSKKLKVTFSEFSK